MVVTFNGLTAIATSWSDTQIVASIPTGGITEPVVVTVNGAASNGSTYTVYFTLTTSISPSPGLAGSTLTSTGFERVSSFYNSPPHTVQRIPP